MALNPRLVTQDVDVTWGGVVKHVPRGYVVDIPPGSDLEAAYGLGNLATLTDQDALSMSNGAGPTATDPGGTGP